MAKKKESKAKTKEIKLEKPTASQTDALTSAVSASSTPPLTGKEYDKELEKLQTELVKMQYWVKEKGLKVVVLFEGRDAAGKGGAIKRITEYMNPRTARVVALPVPSERETTQWYFQRYVAHLPAAGEIVLFDRSWYNRAGVERVMGFCTEDQVKTFFDSVPVFEQLLIQSGIILIKYWFSVSSDEQENRFQDRLDDITTRWKFSTIDNASRTKWYDYARAYDETFQRTNTEASPWHIIRGDDKKKARLNCIHHLLSVIPYGELKLDKVDLPARQKPDGYRPLALNEDIFVPEVY